MHVIGLTGGIGSGKSTVANLFRQAGAEIVDMDAIAHQLTEPGQTGYTKIIQHFGMDILNPDKSINRRKLADAVFADPSQLQRLESILHPRIKQAVLKHLKTLRCDLCVIEIPLLNQRNQFGFLDAILVVDCSHEKQIERIQTRNSLNKSQIDAIINAQLDRDNRLKLADDVIDNNGTIDALRERVYKLIVKYTKQQAESLPGK